MHDFFIGNASEFLPGPIYDLNQIAQVVAGTYNVIHFFFNLTFESLFDPVHPRKMMYNIKSDTLFYKSVQFKQYWALTQI